MGIDTLIKAVLSELQVAINSKTVVGEPISVGNWTVVPITKVSFGFGAGGGEGKKDSNAFGGGSGGGATIEPVGAIVIGPNEVKLLSSKNLESGWEKIINLETAEKIYKKLMGITDNAESKPNSPPPAPPSTPPSTATPEQKEN